MRGIMIVALIEAALVLTAGRADDAQLEKTPPLLPQCRHAILYPPVSWLSERIELEDGPRVFGRSRTRVLRIERPKSLFQGPIGRGLDLKPVVKPVFGPGAVFLGQKGYVSGIGPMEPGMRQPAAPKAAARPVAQADAGLATVVGAWPTLPDHIKAAILSLVKTAEQSKP